jgi:membrane-associated phospholipid phosphatase
MLKKISKKAWLQIGICFAVFAAIATLAALLDLRISHAMYSANSFFGQFFNRVGKFPLWLAAPAAFTITFHQEFGKTKKSAAAWKVATAAFTFLAWFFVMHEFFDSFEIGVRFAVVYMLVLAAFLTAASLLATCKVDKKVMKKLFLFAVFMIIVLAVSNGAVQILKILWSRQRYRTMAGSSTAINQYLSQAPYGGFSPWYKPEFLFRSPIRTQGYMEAFRAYDSDAFASFPSGHAVAAACSFALILLPDIFEKLKKHNWMFWTFPAIYTAIVALSRIVAGAHYLSDVLFGSFIGLTVAALTRFIFVEKMLKKNHLSIA